jgi:hypothetical protein
MASLDMSWQNSRMFRHSYQFYYFLVPLSRHFSVNTDKVAGVYTTCLPQDRVRTGLLSTCLFEPLLSASLLQLSDPTSFV